MVFRNVKPFVMKRFKFAIEDDDFAAAVASCQLVPNQSAQTWAGGTPDDVYTDYGNATWTCVMRIGQDWDDENSLVNYLLDHAGQTKDAVFSPLKHTTGPSFEVVASLTFALPPIGGDINSWAESAITHGVNGQPHFRVQ